MPLTPSKLRSNIYRILDQVADTGVAVEILRGDRRLKIVRADEGAPSKLKRLKARPSAVIGDPQDLVHMDWSKEWKP